MTTQLSFIYKQQKNKNIMTKTISRKEALEKGYLEDKKIVVKPSPRVGQMGITDRKHIAYFQHDQCSTMFSLPRTERGDLVDVFESDEEREFFEKELGSDLNVRKKGNLFETEMVKITMDRKLLDKGETFDLSDPMDNIRLRIIKANSDKVAPSWEDRKKKNGYRWALVDLSKINDEAAAEFDNKIEFGMLMGKHASTTSDLRDLLRIYFGTIRSNKEVKNEENKNVLMREINTISEDKTSRNSMIKIIEDNLFQTKKLMLKAFDYGIVKRENVDTYVFAGDEKTYTFNEMAKTIYDWKNSDATEYFELVAKIEEANK